MRRLRRIWALVVKVLTIPERQCERLLIIAMQREGWTPVRRMRVVRRKR